MKTIVSLCCSMLVMSVATAQEAESDQPLVLGVSYVGLSVSDLDAAVAFYQGACDLKPVENKQISNNVAFDSLAGRSGVTAKSAMLEGYNAQLRLMEFAAPSERARATLPVPVEGPGFMHVCFQVLKEKETYQRVLKAGATTIGNSEMAQLNPRRQIYYAYVHDFDGRVVEIEHIDLGERSKRRPPKVDHRVRHICISTPDFQRITQFYSAFLDKNPREVGPISGEPFDMVSGHEGTEITMAWYLIGNFELEVNQYLSVPTELPEEPRPIDAFGYSYVAFDVSDIDEAAKKVVESGGTVVTEPIDMDGGEIVFARDPDGNLLGLLDVSESALVSTTRFHERRKE